MKYGEVSDWMDKLKCVKIKVLPIWQLEILSSYTKDLRLSEFSNHVQSATRNIWLYTDLYQHCSNLFKPYFPILLHKLEFTATYILMVT